MAKDKRIVLALSEKMHSEVGFLAERVGLTLLDYIRFLLAREIENSHKEEF